MDKLIPLAMVMIAVAVLAIAAKLVFGQDCCCQNQPTSSVAMTDSVLVIPGDTVILVPGDSLVRFGASGRLVVPPGRAALIPAR